MSLIVSSVQTAEEALSGLSIATDVNVVACPETSSLEFSRSNRELERAFAGLAVALPFKQKNLPTPVITIQSQGRRSAYGWFVRRAWTDGSHDVPEINISAEHLRRRTVEIIGTLVHEMVHLDNYLARQRDCSSHNYHNRTFKDLAVRVKLNCERADDGTNRFGWAYTSPSKELCEIIQDLRIDDEIFALYREIRPEFRATGLPWKNDQPAEPKLKKWSCGCTNVWSAVQVRAMCFNPECGGEFRRSDVIR